MTYIPMSIIEYRFDEEGNTTQVVVGFQTYSGRDNLNARLNLTLGDIQEVNSNWNFSNLTQERAEVVARRKLQAWVRVEKPADEPVEEPEAEE